MQCVSLGMTRVKFAKEESTTSVDFIEKRRSALERFLNRIGKHRVLRKDVDYREFLEQEDGVRYFKVETDSRYMQSW